MTFDVEVVLKGRDFAVTESVEVPQADPSSWTDGAVHEVLVGILRAIDRVEHPDAAPDRAVVLQGFSWIVQPAAEGAGVVIAIEIPMGAAVAGPFAIGERDLTERITRVLQAERQAFSSSQTVH